MKYVSLDLETTGLDPATCQVIEVAMVLEDTETAGQVAVEDLPYFTCPMHNDRLTGDYYAINMNWGLIQHAHDIGASGPWHVWETITEWLREHGINYKDRGVLAGKNVAGFDRLFLPPEVSSRFHHRTIDPGSVFVDWSKDVPPSLGELTKRKVAHRALEDARDVVRVLRRSYGGWV